MHVVGGFYKELCELPRWQEEFGSGGRAAALLSGLSEDTTLHTYNRDPVSPGLLSLKKLGVNLKIFPRATDFVFAYFHPLSRPHIEPQTYGTAKETPIRVEAENILVFGFLEGEPIVSGDKVVFDPQSPISGRRFRSNGSKARQLALVLNEHEALVSSKKNNINDAASHLLTEHESDVVVVKAGVRGAWVFERNKPELHVPIYHSNEVFKIGTGDIFSAAFSHFWAEKKETPEVAADKASRIVSKYCQTPILPLADSNIESCLPINGRKCGCVLVVGKGNTLGRKYALEEATHCISALGAQPIPVTFDLLHLYGNEEAPALLISDGFESTEIYNSLKLLNKCKHIIVYCEEENATNKSDGNKNRSYVNDFVTSVYKISWLSMN